MRAGIKTVLIPSENIKDLAEIPDNVKEGLNLIPVSMVDEVLLHALVEKTTAIEVAPVAEASQSGIIDPVGGEGVITH